MKQKYKRIILLFFLCVSTLLAYQVYAAFTILAGSAGTNLSADRANNAIAPLRSTLGQIRFTEGVNTDFSGGAIASGTIILTAPTGWIFNNTGNTTFTAGRDITAASLVATGNTITITVTTNGLPFANDRLNLNNIQVRALNGANNPWLTGNILRLPGNPGTFTLVGVTNGTTNFGSLSQITGTLRNLEVIMSGQARGGAGVGVTGIPRFVFPTLQFQLVGIRAVDQFDNMINTFAGNRILTYTGVSSASGVNNFTTGVSFTVGSSTTTLNTTLRTPGNYRLVVSSGVVVFGTSTQFTVLNGTVQVNAPSSMSLPSSAASTNDIVVEDESTQFTVNDQKGFASGYYTTIQCSNLSGTSSFIPKANIQISGSALTLNTGDANASVYSSLGSSFQSCGGIITFIRRDVGVPGGRIYSEYGATITVQVTIPAWQAVGLYTGAIIYTLIEN